MVPRVWQAVPPATGLVGSVVGALAQTAPPGIWQAAYAGNVAGVTVLLAQTPDSLDAPEPQERATPLHWAAFGGRANVVSLLLEHGVRINSRNRTGAAPGPAADDGSRSHHLGYQQYPAEYMGRQPPS